VYPTTVKGRRRWLVAIGTALIAAAIFLVILAIIPTSNSSGLPDWITQVKPTEFKKSSGSSYLGHVVMIDETRRLPMSMAEFSRKLEADLGKQPAWHNRTSSAANPTWSRGSGRDSGSLWAIQEGNEVVVYTGWTHQPSWWEKTQNKIRSFFGAKD
jgi:hypothetical protein